ncbi:monovalent cation:proton antiporter-2 (CPA2) family protein [Salinisphaera orenii]|uniref:monovalent cation:proton antiporter-2 (CPA2) family protein n=1 Tax=Salinisphaera orenii TaxID=856731 RepID=UPI000DBE848B
MDASLTQIAVYLAAAVIAVTIAQRLKLGSVLGYLAAGVVIGPWAFGLISKVDQVLHFAEFGVVFLLFIIGLEMQPRRLWALRRSILGLGGLQMVLTTVVLALFLGWALALSPAPAFAAGVSLALSSTAFAVQMLAERGEMATRHGRAGFSILLFQDLAVIPILAILPLLSVGQSQLSIIGGLEKTGTATLVIVGLIIGGHYILKPVLRVVAATRMQEIFIAMTLLIVVGTSAIMQAVDVSLALGAFTAGVLLADSEYRHELEANVDPFKDLLLGLFFVAVGMSINLGLFLERPFALIGLTVALMVIKGVALALLGRRYGLRWRATRNLGAYLSQGGEFAFVILSTAVADDLLARPEADLLVAVVTLSMVLTPFAVKASSWLNKRLESPDSQARMYDTPVDSEHAVIIAGFGRFGSTIARLLRAKRIGFTALDVNPEQVDFVRRFGGEVYYGDASRVEMLRAARADRARVLVLAMDDPEVSLTTIQVVQTHFPGLKIVARARDRRHAYQLIEYGVTVFHRETFRASVALAGDVMQALGYGGEEVERTNRTFRRYDEARLREHHQLADDAARQARLDRAAIAELEEQFERDEAAYAATSSDTRTRTRMRQASKS